MMYAISIMNEYLVEIRYRVYYIIISFIFNFFCIYVYKEKCVLLLSNSIGVSFIYTNITEAFFSYLWMCFYGSLYFTTPILIYHIWRFFLPGFFLYEKKIYRMLISIFLLLTSVSFIYTYQYLIPNAAYFFLSFQEKNLLVLYPKISEYIFLIFIFFFYVSLLFQLPLILFLTYKVFGINFIYFSRYRRFIYFLISIFSAVFSPPDLLSQILIAIPCIFLYEFTIFLISILYEYDRSSSWR